MPKCPCRWIGDPDEQHEDTCPREIYLREKEVDASTEEA